MASDGGVIFFAGASGYTGAPIAQALIDAGAAARLRLGFRNVSKGEAWAAKGATVVEFDIENEGTHGALEGVAVAMMIPPFAPGIAELSEKFVNACKAKSVPHIVGYSASGVPEDPSAAPADLFKEKAHALRKFLDSGIPYTIVSPTFYFENEIAFNGGTIKGSDEPVINSTAAAEGAFTPVALSDIAAGVKTILLDPAAHAGKNYTFHGPEVLTMAKYYETLSEAIGRKVTFAQVPVEGFHEATKAFIPEWNRDALVALDLVKTNSWTAFADPEGQLAALKGAPLVTFAEWAAANKGAFERA